MSIELLSDRMKQLQNGYVLHEDGITFERELQENEWIELGLSLAKGINRDLWRLGDWLVFGHGASIGSRWTGSGFENAAKLTGYSKGHLANLYRVSKFYPRDRRTTASWTVHMDCMRSAEPYQLLRHATMQRLSSNEVEALVDQEIIDRQKASAAKIPASTITEPVQFRARKRKDKTAKSPYYDPREVQCPECGHVFPILGNKVTGKTGS